MSQCCFVIRNTFFSNNNCGNNLFQHEQLHPELVGESSIHTRVPLLCGLHTGPNSTYCAIHNCAIQGCYQQVCESYTISRYCAQHQCHSICCQQPCGVNSLYCDLHRCKHPNCCESIAIKSSDKCLKHMDQIKCQIDSCQVMIPVQNMMPLFYCEHHQCKHCRVNPKCDEFDYCCQCKCLYSKCNNLCANTKTHRCFEHHQKICEYSRKECVYEKLPNFSFCEKHKCFLKLCQNKIYETGYGYDYECSSYCHDHDIVNRICMRYGFTLSEIEGADTCDQNELLNLVQASILQKI
jgi:hypothetical protein